MFCPKCGKINPDSESVCSGCGAELKEEGTQAAPARKGRALKLVLSLIAVVVVIVLVILLLNGCKAPTKDMSF